MIPQNILVVNQPLNNRGDEAAHRALIHGLLKSFPEASIVVLSFEDHNNYIADFIVDDSRVEYNRFMFNRSYRMHDVLVGSTQMGCTKFATRIHPLLRHLLPIYQKADIVVCAPGGICMGGFQSWQHLFFLQLAKELNKKIIYYSRSIGPFPESTWLNRRFRDVSYNLMRYFSFLSLRDRKSEIWAKNISVSFIPTVDTAFLEQPKVVIPESIRQNLKEKYVIFVPNQLTWHYMYKDVPNSNVEALFINTMKILRKEFLEHQIVMLPQICSLGDRGDYSFFVKLKERCGDDNVYVVPDTYGADIQQTIISKASMVVGARYHTIVFSINNEVPFMAFSYEAKITGLLEVLGMQDHLIDITQSLNEQKEICALEEKIASRIKYLRNQSVSNKKAIDIAGRCLDCMKETIQKL